jgi:hypothetical protein
MNTRSHSSATNNQNLSVVSRFVTALAILFVCAGFSGECAQAQALLPANTNDTFLMTNIQPDKDIRRIQTTFGDRFTLQEALRAKRIILKNVFIQYPHNASPSAELGTNAQRGVVEFPRVVLNLSDVAPFLCVSVKLRMNASHASNVQVFVRPLSETGEALAEKTVLPFDEHFSPNEEGAPNKSTPNDALTLVTHLTFLPKETHALEVRIELSRTILHSTPILRGMEVFAYNSGATKPELLSSLQRGILPRSSEIFQQKEQSTVQNTTLPRPNFLTRTDWGCPWGRTSGPNTLTSTPPTHLIVHHSFSPGNNVTDWVAAVRGIWTFHVMSNGWSDIGYNWLIDPNGTIYEGRAWVGEDDNTQGAHFCGFNRNTMGVCMLGDFTSITPTEAALKSLVRILGYRASVNNIDVRGTSFHANSQRTLNNISGHRDGCSTACPGESLYPLLPTLRNRVFAFMNPPSVRNQAVSVSNRTTAQISCAVRANGSETELYIEWNDAGTLAAQNPQFTNRQFVQRISATQAETTASVSLTNLNPSVRYAYRFVAQNSDTSMTTQQGEFTTLNTNVQSPNQTMFSGVSLRISPNPTNAESQVWYRLQSASEVQLELISATGARVMTLASTSQASGEYSIPLRTDALSSGVYYCRLLVRGSAGEAYQLVPVVVAK